ncbi:MAG: hypothetical protein WC473_01425 [Patescibacteria group bacterium]
MIEGTATVVELSPFCISPVGKKARSFALVYQGRTPEQEKIELENYSSCGDPFAAMSPDSLMVKDLIDAIHQTNDKMAFSMSGISLGDNPMELLFGIRRGQFKRLFIIAMEHDPLQRPHSRDGLITGACVAFDIITLCEMSAVRVPPIFLIVSSGTEERASLTKSLDEFRPTFEKHGVRIIDERKLIHHPRKYLR